MNGFKNFGAKKNGSSVECGLIRAGQILGNVVCAYGFWLLFTVRAEAYIDPSVMTYVIQAVAGVIIAIGAAIGIYIRKAKRKVQDKLGLEETKEQESDDIVIKETSQKEA